MKKIFCTLIVAILLLSSITVSVFAVNDGTVSGDSVYSSPGSTVEIPIRYTDNPGFWIMFLQVNFDSEIFEYDSIEKGDYQKVDIAVNTYSDPGKILLDIEGKEFADLKGDGVIATLKLYVKETAKVGNYAVALSIDDGNAVNFDVKYVKPEITNGSVYVTCDSHNFKGNTCATCGAVRENDKVVVDVEKLPEPVVPEIKDDTASSGSSSSSESSKPSQNSNSTQSSNSAQNSSSAQQQNSSKTPNSQSGNSSDAADVDSSEANGNDGSQTGAVDNSDIDATDSSQSGVLVNSQEAAEGSDLSENAKADSENSEPDMLLLILVCCVAVLLVCGVVVFAIVKKKKNSL